MKNNFSVQIGQVHLNPSNENFNHITSKISNALHPLIVNPRSKKFVLKVGLIVVQPKKKRNERIIFKLGQYFLVCMYREYYVLWYVAYKKKAKTTSNRLIFVQ